MTFECFYQNQERRKRVGAMWYKLEIDTAEVDIVFAEEVS